MPAWLYYTPDDNLGPRIVGQSNRFHYVDDSTALELVKRLNVGGSAISTVDDIGLFRRWLGDLDYLQESDFQQINHLVSAIEFNVSPPFVAPPKIYQTSRKLRKNLQLEEHFTWRIPVDVGFSYLLRLHFSFFGIEFVEGGMEYFSILIQNLAVEPRVNVIQFNGGGNRIPIHRDYLVILKGDKDGCKRDLRVSLQPFDEPILGLLKGLEIFKLSNLHNSLASPNPSGPIHTYSSWTSKIRVNLLTIWQSHVVMTRWTFGFALANSVVYLLGRFYGHTFWQEENVESTPDEPSCHRFSLAQILLATEDFNEALVIGKGGFGKVYKGFIYECPEVLAIKRLKPDSKQGAREFWREIETLSKLRHVNLVSLLGYCMEGDEMILVYQYMPRGTIADNLYKCGRNGNERIPLNWEQRLRICIDAARGLDYLHTGTQHGIIHRDVKDTNILLDENLVAKISDFGLSKLGKKGETHGEVSTNVKGTIGYMDPNYLTTRKPSTKSDVYAFGIVLLVVISGRPAMERRLFFEETKSLLDCYRECVAKGEMKEIIDPCLHKEISTESLTGFMEAIGKCLRRRPKKRPTMAELVFHLENVLEEHIGAMSFTLGTNSAGSNRPFQFYDYQVAPTPEESIISQPKEGSNTGKEIQKADLQTRVEESIISQPKEGNNTSKEIRKADLQTRVEVKDRKITPKPLWVRPLVSFRNIFKPSKKMDLALPTDVRMFSLKDIKLATKDFSANHRIGRGSLYVVYEGFIKGNTGIVEIKRYKSSKVEAAQVFSAEVGLQSMIRNVHLVSFVGLCNENKELIVVYEYMSRGSLNDHLFGNNTSKNEQTCLTWEQRLKICIGVARGLKYLHDAGVIYRDLCIEYIMLDDNFEAKISEFDMCRMLSLGESESHVTTRMMGTHVYADPSYFLSGRLSKASDVYSFGIVLLVVLSGRVAFDIRLLEERINVKTWYEAHSQLGNFKGLIDPKLVGGIPSASLAIYLKLVRRCVCEDPKSRPVMAQVIANLKESLNLLGINNGKEERKDQSKDTPSDLSKAAEQVELRAQIARLRELHKAKGHGETKRLRHRESHWKY